MRAAVAALAATVLTGGLGGCSSGEPEQAGTAPSRSATAGDEAPKVSGDTGDLVDPVGGISALSEVTCEANASGVWSARGTLTNDEGVPRTYLVKFAVVREKTSEVLGSKQEQRTLKAGQSVRIELGDLHRGKPRRGLVCVPRVVSGSA